MGKCKKIGSTGWLLIALAAGIICGLVFGERMTVVQPIGDIFINLIKMSVIPIVMCSIITSTASIGDTKKLGRIGSKMIALYVVTTALAATLGLLIAFAAKLGQGVVIEGSGQDVEIAAVSILEVLYNIVPSNIFEAMANFDTLPCIVFSLLFGIALIMIGDKSKPVLVVLDACSEALHKIISMVMMVAPIGIFCLISANIGAYGIEVFTALGKMILLIYITVPLLIILYLILVYFYGGMPPKKFISGGFKIFMTAFTTRSSSATLPVNMGVCINEFDVPDEIAKFTLPIGCTINMNGAAIQFAMTAVLAGYVFGHPLSLTQCVTAVFICTLAGIGMPGIPNAGLVFNVLLFTTMGFPSGALLGMLASIECLVDMMTTSGNVMGDAACAVLIAASEKKYEQQA